MNSTVKAQSVWVLYCVTEECYHEAVCAIDLHYIIMLQCSLY